jgi:cyclic beta-1,2-glucan synthetase
VHPRRWRDHPLPARVRDSGLLQCYRRIAAVIREEGVITPAAEWLVDTFYVVEDVLSRPGSTASSRSSRKVPSRAPPPVVGLAWAVVAHTDSRFEPEILRLVVWRMAGRLTKGEQT